MPRQNRVTPDSRIIATPALGMFMGNLGCLHDDAGNIRRSHANRRWIICLLEFKDRKRELMQPGRYTELFFLDEVTALAAGHRPCAECQRERYTLFRRLWADVHGLDHISADDLDAALHAERLNADGSKQTYRAALTDLPDGVFVRLDQHPDAEFLVLGDRLFRWTPSGYIEPIPRPADVSVTALTPPSTVKVLAAGYAPVIHASALGMSVSGNTASTA